MRWYVIYLIGTNILDEPIISVFMIEWMSYSSTALFDSGRNITMPETCSCP
jgi:hypothetical protein